MIIRILLVANLMIFLVSLSFSPSTSAQEIHVEEDLKNFINIVIPNLVEINKSFQLNKTLGDSEEVSDLLTFSYYIAVTRLGKRLGAWDKEIRTETIVNTYIFCPLPEYLGLPPKKDEKYKEEMGKIGQLMYKGAFETTIARLSLKRKFFTISYKTLVEEKKLPAINDLVNREYISPEKLGNLREFFK